jgi:transposase
MDLRRTSIAMQKQILELHQQGFKIRKIVRVLGVSRNTVRSILRDDSEAELVVTPSISFPTTNWQQVELEFNKGVTLKTLWQELAPNISYWSFWKKFTQNTSRQPKTTIRLYHNPGEKIFFDFTDGIFLTDRISGLKIKTQLFVGIMPFSSFTCGEFVMDQKQMTFTKAIENSFHEVGGVPRYVVIDNLKGGVTKAHIYDPDVNQAFIEFANHWGFAVLPARPRKPKDKAAVEGGIGLIQRLFYGEVRNRNFYSLHELNIALQEFLARLNSSPMKDHGDVSRLDRFQNEKINLLPLKTINFELSTWKTCKVHPDCHVQVERKFYSVPYQFVGQTVKVRIKQNLIDIFSDATDPIAIHAKLKGTERASTIDAHYYPVAVARFEVKYAINIANKVGPKTTELIEGLFKTDQPLRYLRRAQGILRLVQKNEVSYKNLEYACGQALLFNRTQFKYIRSVALYHKSGGSNIRIAVPIRDANTIFLHNQQSED